MRRALLLLLAALVLAGCGGGDDGGEDEAAAPAEQPQTAEQPQATTQRPGDIVDLENVLALRSDFEADAGKARVLILLSPT